MSEVREQLKELAVRYGIQIIFASAEAREVLAFIYSSPVKDIGRKMK
ncbi:MAG: hypothetical protein JRI56_08115 [Deltaproteobacteria bacterium]|nr:hypothetical protein [Deltaproteobacteria bacterium]